MTIDDFELTKIVGGAITFSGSYINAWSRLINILFEIGKTIGSSINYYFGKKTC